MPLAARLGSAEEFAQELRNSAGLPPRQADVVPSEEGPHRRYYGVSDLGRELLGEWSGRWRNFVQAIDGLLAPHTEVLG